MTMVSRDRRATLFRIALGLTALSLWAYIPYRYVTRPPGWEGVLGTAYAVLFPVAGLLALAALLTAWKPELIDWLAGRNGARTVLAAYGASWLAMGLMCVPSLQATAAAAPLKGALATVHMTAQHVFLGLAAVGAAWRPGVAASILLARPVTSIEDVGDASPRRTASG